MKGTELSVQRCLCISYVFLPRFSRLCMSAYIRNINIPFSCRSIFAPDGRNDGKSRNLQYVFPGEACFARISLHPHLHYTGLPSFSTFPIIGLFSHQLFRVTACMFCSFSRKSKCESYKSSIHWEIIIW